MWRKSSEGLLSASILRMLEIFFTLRVICHAGKEACGLPNVFNSKVKDSSSKVIFEDSVPCAQFLRGYVDISLFREVQQIVIIGVDETEEDIREIMWRTDHKNKTGVMRHAASGKCCLADGG